ncbi:MAG TPA: TolC family protein [Thermoanaerobaculia bacterium]|nr:TolC family protein [Thermoanaerobaculia bacterium]
MKRSISWLLLALTAVPVQAQEPLTLAEAVERALAKFPSVETARARQEEAAAALAAEELSRRVRGRFTASATQFQEPMVVTPIHGFGPGLFPEFDETLLQGQLTVSYTLYDGRATEARIRAARSQLGGAGAALGDAEQALGARVAAAYLRAVGRSRVLAAHDRRLAALDAELGRARQRFDVGKAPQVEVIRAEAALEGARAERVSYATALDNAERELARLLGAPVEETRAARLAPVQSRAGTPPDREALIQAGIEASPAVLQAREQLASAEAAVTLAESALKPELRAVANLNEWSSSDLDLTTEWNAGFQLTVPLFDGGSLRKRVARAEAARRAAAEQVRLAEIAVREDVDRAAAAAEEARARVESLEKAVERFAEVSRVQKLLLDNGAGTQTDYLTAEADLLAARANLADAEHAAVLARVDLARAAGRLTPAWIRENLRETMEREP